MIHPPIAYKVQTLDCHGVPTTEYCHQPERSTDGEENYTPNLKLIHRGEQDRLERTSPRFPASAEYMRGYKAPCAHYITEIQDDTAERNHYLITLVHRKTGEEKLVDLLTDAYGFSIIRVILNCHNYDNWGVFEVLDLEEPF
jgi:hypothetical protein